MHISTCGGLAVALTLLAGCATTPPPPRTDIAQAEVAIDQAVTNDAAQYAPLSLKEARDKLDQANSAYAREDYGAANRLAEQALVNGQLALAETQSARAEELVQENLRSVQTLREELQRNQAGTEATR